MKCEKCGHHTRVLETRPGSTPETYRRRLCLNAACGARVTTVETIVKEPRPASRPAPAGEAALAAIAAKRKKVAAARRANEDYALSKELGLDEDDYFGDEDDGR